MRSIRYQIAEADISTPEGMKSIGERQLMTTFCPQLVVDVIEILEEIMQRFLRKNNRKN